MPHFSELRSGTPLHSPRAPKLNTTKKKVYREHPNCPCASIITASPNNNNAKTLNQHKRKKKAQYHIDTMHGTRYAHIGQQHSTPPDSPSKYPAPVPEQPIRNLPCPRVEGGAHPVRVSGLQHWVRLWQPAALATVRRSLGLQHKKVVSRWVTS